MSNFTRWVSLTYTMRLHVHYGSAGEGHTYQGRFKSFPIQDDELKAVRWSVKRGSP